MLKQHFSSPYLFYFEFELYECLNVTKWCWRAGYSTPAIRRCFLIYCENSRNNCIEVRCFDEDGLGKHQVQFLCSIPSKWASVNGSIYEFRLCLILVFWISADFIILLPFTLLSCNAYVWAWNLLCAVEVLRNLSNLPRFFAWNVSHEDTFDLHEFLHVSCCW